jgi:hypothetical protein
MAEMPLAFPSHQGLILPLARRWPHHFNVLALCVGAAMPDVVDGFLGLIRGHLGQWYGHTLAGTVVLCVPGGLLLTRLIAVASAYLSYRFKPALRIQEVLVRAARSSTRWDAPSRTGFRGNRLILLCWSVWIGAFSHLLFDLISHGTCLWLYPLYGNIRVFPPWWYTAWMDIPLPFYEDPYPFGPHLVVWLVLTILGAILFFEPALRNRREINP